MLRRLPKAAAGAAELVTIEPEQRLDEALRLMAQHKIRRLPVVEGDRLVGILGQADVALEEKDKRVGAVVEQITEPTAAGAARECLTRSHGRGDRSLP